MGLNTIFPFNILTLMVPFFVQHRAMADSLWYNLLGKPVSSDGPGFLSNYKAEFLASYDNKNARDGLLAKCHVIDCSFRITKKVGHSCAIF